MAALNQDETPTPTGIAIVGMTGRFPGARDLDTYWRNLREGVESVAFFSADELAAQGVTAEMAKHPQYVRARGVLDELDMFDAAFFGYSPKDALIMDPQQRIFLQCSWEALEVAGYDPRTYKGLIGVYAGATTSSYPSQLFQGLPASQLDGMALALGNDLAFLTTRVSYKLDLKGPSYPVQTACSTSLVAVHVACQALLNSECDIAIAGGVSMRLPQQTGYWYQEEGIFSPDGHCRPFDARAQGMLFSNGLGIVVLKRLDDAIADGDTIYAVVKGSAVNNDGSRRASFTAPSVVGQTNVVADALAAADIDPETITYVEAHGTATALGDSIELQALTKAFGVSRRQYCAIGSVKSNIGHLDAAAGIAGMIKTVLAMRHRQLPPTLHFEAPNPDIKFEQTPFYVNAKLAEWPEGDTPRRAGVSSFGFGGTNAHVVLEEAPELEPSGDSRAWQLLPISAESERALDAASGNLAGYLAAHPEPNLADAAYTLKIGRRAFRHRRVVVSRTGDEAARLLEARNPKFVLSGHHDGPERPVVFLFPGQGSQYVNMAADLYAAEPVFEDVVDTCAEVLHPHLGVDLRTLLYPADGVTEESTRQLTETRIAQPALFVVEYALARLWMSWGVQPQACLGHSIGEFVAACIAGVFSLEDALRLVALRGKLMQQMPSGVMLAVPLPESRVSRLTTRDVWLAAVNAPSLCVVSGTEASIDAVEQRLQSEGIQCQRLQTSHAFHSGLMDGAAGPFVDAVRQTQLSAPKVPFISNITGRFIDASEATNPEYWGRQLRSPVAFAAGAAELLNDESRVFLEVGPGHTLSTLMRRQAGARGARDVASSLRHAHESTADGCSVLLAMGRLWLAGAGVDWLRLTENEERRRVALPTYPFDKQRYWPPAPTARPAAAQQRRHALGKIPRVDDWFYVPSWTEARLPVPNEVLAAEPQQWLLFAGVDMTLFEHAVRDRLERAGHEVVIITPSDEFRRIDARTYAVNPLSRADYEAMLADLSERGSSPAGIVHLWGIGGAPDETPLARGRRCFDSVLHLAQALGDAESSSSVRINLVTSGLHAVTGMEAMEPEKSIVLGLCHVIGQEYPHLTCKSIDVDASALAQAEGRGEALDELVHDMLTDASSAIVAYRRDRRWVQTFRPLRLPAVTGMPARLRQHGTYLITGGLGDIALNFAEYLARTAGAKLVLTGRTALPPEAEWDAYLAGHDQWDLTAQRIARVRGIRALGGEVLILQADVANRAEMRDAFATAEARFGGIDGVIHAAGVIASDGFKPISETDADLCARQFQPKVDGLAVLEAVLEGRTPDFCLLVSSLSAILGGLRYAAYASANAYLDAVAHDRNRTSRFPWITVNWDGWLRVDEEARLKSTGGTPSGFVMTAAEGTEAFHRILGTSAGVQVVVSTGDLQTRLEQWVAMPSAAGGESADASEAVRMPRPSLQTEYVAPGDDLERAIAAIWQELLGVDRVGLNDSFFELGGDSLLGIQVIARIKKQLGVKVSAVTLYEGPTVGLLADIIRTNSRGQQPALVDASRSRGERRRDRKRRQDTPVEAMGA